MLSFHSVRWTLYEVLFLSLLIFSFSLSCVLSSLVTHPKAAYMRSIRFAQAIPLVSGILCFTLAWAGYTLIEIHSRHSSVETKLISTWVEGTVNTVLMMFWIAIRKDMMFTMEEHKVPIALPIAYMITATTMSLLEAQLVIAICSHVKTYGLHCLLTASFWRAATGDWSQRVALGVDTAEPGARTL